MKTNGVADSSGDDRNLSFEQIHKKYQPRIYNLILHKIGSEVDAEDLTAKTFQNAWQNWAGFRGDAQVFTWLCTIAFNLCKNFYKQRDRKREREPISLDDSIETDSGALSREVADWRNAPEEMLMDSELSAQIQKAIDALPIEYREILILAQFEQMPYEEIARVTGRSVPGVKTRLHRARLKLRQRLEPYYRGWTGPER